MRRWLYFSLALFFGLLVGSWITHGKGVIRNDPARGIDIPSERLVPLQVKAAFDGKQIYLRYRWPTPKRNIEYDMLRYEGGKWVRDGQAKSQGDYEDRVSTMIDDGSVPEFDRYGAYTMANLRMWSAPDDSSVEDEVMAHPYLGVKKGQREVGKFLPSTRQRPADWASVVPEPELARLRAAGYFVDLWQWHINRTNPFGKADDGVVAEARFSDGGKGALFATNWDAKSEQPKLMFDPKKTGRRALSWSDITGGKLAAGDIYLHDDQTTAFDPSLPWKDGDTIPRRVLRSGEGSASDVSAVGPSNWHDGYREVILTRALATGHPEDDKTLVDKGVYTVAFAIHRTTEGSRYHYVSLPVTLGLDRDAQLNARNIPTGSAPTWEQPWTDVTLFYPGRVAWATLTSSKHAGSKFIEKGVPVKLRHSETQLAQYGIEAVFASEIWRQWILTLFGGLALITGFGIAINLILPRERASGSDASTRSAA